MTPGQLLADAAAAVRAGASLDAARDAIADWLDQTAWDAAIRARIWHETGHDPAPLAETHYRLPLAAARAIRAEENP